MTAERDDDTLAQLVAALGPYVDRVVIVGGWPLVGAEFTRGGDRDVTTPIVGVSAQKLRHLDVLLFSPWTVTLPARGTPHSVLIANPVCYLAQKLLISVKRTPGARAKDILYIHDTLSLFSRSLPELHDMTGLGGVPRGDRLGRLAAAAASEYTS